jgi:tetratricopeptide (TPR) repeat protein
MRIPVCALWVALLAVGCGAANPTATRRSPARSCPPAQSWDGASCRTLSSNLGPLRKGEKQLEAFLPEEAAAELEKARASGPYRHGDYVRVFEQLSVAYAYLGNEKKALESFDMVLALSPGHAISYTLSPQATFLFERARKEAASRTPPAVRVTWPRRLDVAKPVPVEVEVMADPKAFLSRARLFARRAGDESYSVYEVSLPTDGTFERIVLPPVAPDAASPQGLDMYLAAYDPRGNEVLLWGAPDRPNTLELSYDPPTPWYKKWWVWTIAGSAVALGTGVAVYAITREPGATVDGGIEIK